MARKNKGDCIDSRTVSFTGAAIETIPPVIQATRALLQFYTDEDGVGSIGQGLMAYQPLVMITENGSNPVAGWASTNGMGIFHMGFYEVEGSFNLANVKFMAFGAGYDVFCKIQYYK